ncbi:MAG TPA: YrhB domain-containing protein [Chthonomonadaceae bacterium]|nr:YrhB domain-containing protein [Chthonomonadaceae bacterium]
MSRENWSELYRNLHLADAALTGAVRAIGEGRLAWALDAIAGAQEKVTEAIRQIHLEDEPAVAQEDAELKGMGPLGSDAEGHLLWALKAAYNAALEADREKDTGEDSIAALLKELVVSQEQIIQRPKRSHLTPTIDLTSARQKVTEYIQAVVDQSRYKDDPDHAPMIGGIIEKDYGWVFTWNARKFFETQDDRYMLTGTRPILIEKESGDMRVLSFWWERDLQKYEAQREQTADTNGHARREISEIG